MDDQQGFARPKDSPGTAALTLRNIAEWLGHTFSCHNSAQIADAERHLANASQGPKFVDSLTFIMSEHTFSQDIRKAASTYLRRYAENVMKARNQPNINRMTEGLLKALSVPTIPLALKQNIVGALQHILVKDQSNHIRKAFTPNLITVLNRILRQPTPNSQEYEYVVLFGVFMLAFPRYDDLAVELVRGCYRNYICLVLNILDELSKRVEEAQRWLLILDEAMSLMTLFFSRSDLSSNRSLSFILAEPALGAMLNQVIGGVGFGRNCFNVRFQSTHFSIHNENDTLVNAVDLARIYLSHRLKNPPDDIAEASRLQQTAHEYLKLLYGQAVALLHAVKHPNQTIRETLSDRPVTRSMLNAVRSIISFLGEMLQFAWLEEFYRSPQFSNVLEDLLLPLLEFSVEEKEMFVDNAQEIMERYGLLLDYQLIAQDKSNGFMDESVAVQLTTSHLLALMAKHLHGWLPQVVSRLTGQLIGQHVQLPARLSLVLLLGMLCFPLAGRSDMELVKQYLLKNMPYLATPTEQVDVKAEHALQLLLVSRYVPILKNPDFNLRTISVMLNLLNDGELCSSQPALVHGSIQCLSVVLQMVKSHAISQPVFVELVRSLERLVFRESICMKVFQLLMEVFNEKKVAELVTGQFRSEFDSDEDDDDTLMEEESRRAPSALPMGDYHHLALSTVKLMVERVEAVLSNRQQPPSEEKQVITKCWNAIREILCHPNPTIATDEFLKHGDTLVARLYRFIGLDSCYFDDDALQLNAWLLSRLKSVTPHMLKLFEYLLKIIHRNNSVFSIAMFEFVLLFLRHGRELLCNSEPAVQVLLDLCIDAMMVKLPDYSRKGDASAKLYVANESDPCRAVMLLEQLVMHCSLPMKKPMWNTLVESLCNRLTKHQYVKFSFFKSHIIACLGLCLLNNPYQVPSSQSSQSIYNKLISEAGCFDVSYTVKLYVFVASEILKRYSMMADLQSQKLFALFRCLIRLMIINYEKERNRLQQLVPAESNEQYEQFPEVDEQQYEMAMKLISNEVTQSDQFDHFRQTMEWMKDNSKQCLDKFHSLMSSDDVEYFRRVYSIKRVETGARHIYQLKRR